MSSFLVVCLALAGERPSAVLLARMTTDGPRLVRVLEGELPVDEGLPPFPEGAGAAEGELLLVTVGEAVTFAPAGEEELSSRYERLRPRLGALARLVDSCELAAVGEVDEVQLPPTRGGTARVRAVLDVRVRVPLFGSPAARLTVHLPRSFVGAGARVGRKAFFLRLDDATGALVPVEGGVVELASDLDQSYLLFSLRRIGVRVPPVLTTEAATLRAWTECWNAKDFEGTLLCYTRGSAFRKEAETVRESFMSYPAEVQLQIESVARVGGGSAVEVVATATAGDFVRTSRCTMRFVEEGGEFLILDDGFAGAR